MNGKRRFGDLVAVLLIGVVVVGAALVPAVTASSGETTTIRGDVVAAGRPLAFFPIGFWAPSGSRSSGVLATGTTDAKGDFTLEVPVTQDGFAYAGAAPDSARAVVDSGDGQVVRGVIGKKGASPVASPLYQGFDAATPRSLAGGGRLHFVLQAPGRLTGTSPVRGAALQAAQVRRLDGSVVQRLTLDSRGRFESEPLAPGNYEIAIVPKSPLLPVVVRARVRAGAAAAVALTAPVRGAEVVGEVLAGTRSAGAGVPVLLLDSGGALLARTTTAAGGGYRFTGVAPGQDRVLVGQQDPPTTTASTAGTASGATPAPTASTASPTPSPTASTPQQAALVPVPVTDDTVLPATTDVVVPAGATTVRVTTRAAQAGRISGTVRGAEGASVQVLVEDTDTHRVIRTTTADAANGRYTMGGLPPDEQVLVLAVTRPDDPTQARTGSTTGYASTSTTGVDVRIDAPALSVTGTVSGAAHGTVTIGDGGYTRSATVDASGAYAVQGLVPGAYPVVVRTPDRLAADPVALDLEQEPAAQTTLDLQRGPAAAAFTGWFISGGAGVPRVSGTATDAAGDVLRLGPRSRSGHVTARGARPGTYTYDADSFAGTVPAVDGPWWFTAPAGSFTLQAGQTLNAGPIVLHARAG